MLLFLLAIIFSAQVDEYISQKVQETFSNLGQVLNTPQFLQAQKLFNEKKYEEALLLLSKEAVNNPDLQLPFVTSMYVLTQQLNDNVERAEALKKYIEISEQIKDSISVDARNQLLSDLAEAKTILGSKEEADVDLNELLKGAGDNTTLGYAKTVYQLAINAISSNNYQKAMILLEDLRRHKNNYPVDIQDRVDFQLFNIYFNLKKTDFILKLGEELRERLNKRGVDSWDKAKDLFNILKNLGDTYYFRKDYEKAYKIYEEFEDLYKKFPPSADHLFEQMFKYLAYDVASNKKSCLLCIKRTSDTLTNEINEDIKEESSPSEVSNKQTNDIDPFVNKTKNPDTLNKEEGGLHNKIGDMISEKNTKRSIGVKFIFIPGCIILLFVLGIFFFKNKKA